ncbi:uncharacterized protein PAE49_010433 [Odontesthes bonariensis]|uniref:uncharacterized protein LOC142388998 n=1 Tax=Odontesthes bonariensis TaxID=219752 RepID=UPI003F58805A
MLNASSDSSVFCPSDPSEAILRSMQRSRRLLFVVSPGFLAEKSFSLLECRLGLYLQHGHQASIVAVVYRSISKLPCVEVAQLRQASVCTVAWRGSRSEPRRSRFWLRLRLALPVRALALGRRMIDSTSSHSDLAALALQRAQRIQNQNQRTNQSHRNRRTSASQSRRDRKGRGLSARREEGPQHSRRCSGCAGFMGQVEYRGVELTAVTEMWLGSCDGTNVQSDPVPETDSTPIPDSAHEANHTPSPDSAHEANHTPSPDSAHEASHTPSPDSAHEANHTPSPDSAHEANHTPSPDSTHEANHTPSPDPAHKANHTPSPDPAHKANHTPSPDSAPIVGQQDDTENHMQQQLIGSRTAEDRMSAGKEEGLVVKVALTVTTTPN